MIPTINSFPPIASDTAHLLILGSMPGIASLRVGQYYAHPQNLFWPLLGEILGFDARLAYEDRVAYLHAAEIAVWDVLASCQRVGSLDAHIDPASAEPNDFAGFLAAHPAIRHVCFNGAAAEALYRRHVLPGLSVPIDYQRLPSTSPANASITLSTKQAAWSHALRLR